MIDDSYAEDVKRKTITTYERGQMHQAFLKMCSDHAEHRLESMVNTHESVAGCSKGCTANEHART